MAVWVRVVLYTMEMVAVEALSGVGGGVPVRRSAGRDDQ